MTAALQPPRAPARLALVGAPNSGKTTLFNGLTGGLAKTANYAGTTVESRRGRFETPAGHSVELVDLPGVYGLEARSTDERVAIESIEGKRPGGPPDALILVADAANLRTHLHTILQMKALGRPVIVALNMIDLATRDGVQIDVERWTRPGRLRRPRPRGPTCGPCRRRPAASPAKPSCTSRR